jgi:antirestriction protein ArdC
MRQSDIYEAVTQRVIEQIGSGTPPWRRPWMTVGGGLPFNASSNRRYNGVNVWLLLMAADAKGFDSSRWATFKQWKQLGGFVRRGEHGTKIIFWNIVRETATNPVTGEEEEQKRVFARQYTVFNLAQCGGEALERFREPSAPERSFFDYAPAEQLIERSGAEIQFGGNRACYDIVGDYIRMPEKGRFDSEADFYSTIFHELAHHSGHESRLNRLDKLARFGDESYAMEELVAEMAASFVCASLGIENTAAEQQSASYLAGWLKVLKGDRTAIFTASKLAAAASDYLLSFSGSEHVVVADEIPF